MDEVKTRDQRIAELLEQSSSDAVGAIKGPSLSDLTQPEPRAEAPEVQEEEETPTGGKKVRIPASRLKTLTSEIETLRSQVQSTQGYQERIAALEAQLHSNKDDQLPDWWKEAYGDNELSKKGYENQKRIMEREFDAGLQRLEAQRQADEEARTERVEAIEATFDGQMDDLEETLGRELTDNQKGEIMDIVGEYSPMEGDKYLAYMPINKAYDIWQKGQISNPAKQEMARIAGTSSSGGSSQTSSPNAPQWGDWRKRFGS